LQIYAKFLTLAELTARRKLMEKQANKEKEKIAKAQGIMVHKKTVSDKFTTMHSFQLQYLKQQEENFDLASLTLNNLVDMDILMKYTDFLAARTEHLAQNIIKASALSTYPDPNGVISWENFLTFHVVVIYGKGSKEHIIKFLTNLFCPRKDAKNFNKDEVMTTLREIVTFNKRFNSTPEIIEEVCTAIWNGDLLPAGCIENHTILKRENFMKAMECDKIYAEVFLNVVNPDLEEVEEADS
jgi:hypothetical protein